MQHCVAAADTCWRRGSVVGGIHHQIVRAGVVVDLEHLLPGLAAVSVL
jgi:hypothetical protein